MPRFVWTALFALCFLLLNQTWLLRADKVQLLGFGASWKYDHSGTNHGTAWREPSFDDSAWPSGSGVLGYPPDENLLGYSSIRTHLSRFINGVSGPQPITYYFRTRFEFTNDVQAVSLVASNLVDDGAIIYLNGAEAARLGLAADTVDFQTVAIRENEIWLLGLDVANLPNASLRQGENVLAVELHQSRPTSSDVIWGMSLWADVPADGPVSFVLQPADQTNMVGKTVTLVSRPQGTRPFAMQWSKSGVIIPGATNGTLIISNTTVVDTGRYSLTLSNSFSSAVSRTAVLIVLPPPEELVPFNQVWRYQASATDLGTAWREPGYADTSWPAGSGPLGQESAALPQPLRTSFALTNSPTYYFRTQFAYVPEAEGGALEFLTEIDDGAVIHLNGAEVLRLGMPPGAITFGRLANRSVGDAALESFVIPALPLVTGNNVLAVEVHQLASTSVDMVMGLRLSALHRPPTKLTITNQPADLTVEVNRPAVFSVGVQGATRRYQWFKNGDPIPGANASSYRIASTTAVDAGRYSVVVSNVLHLARSREALLTVLADTNGPALLDADGSDQSDQILITFSEAPMEATATNTGNYILTNAAGGTLQIFGAARSNGTNVLIRSEPREPGMNYILVARGLEDQLGNLNTSGSSAPVATRVDLLEFDSTWNFYNPFPGVDEPDLGVAWRNPDYNLDAWGEGRAAFWLGTSSGDLPLGTKLSQGAVTTYFRTSLSLMFSPVGATLSLRHAIDSGAIFYLSGEEILRVNMPEGTIDFLTLAAQESPPTLSESVVLPWEDLLPGEKLLAAELHGSVASDATLFFTCEINARVLSFVGGPVIFTRQPPDLLLPENGALTLDPIMIGADRFQWLMNGQPIIGATNPVYRLAHATVETHGARFQLWAANDQFSALSRENVVTLILDLEPPAVVSAIGRYDQITATFSEPVDLASATNPANYSLREPGENLSIVSAQLVNERTVVLTLSRIVMVGDILRVRGVNDTSQSGNELAPTEVRVGFDPVLVPFSAEWRYDESGVDRGIAWREPAFNDSAWPVGSGLFGVESAFLPEPLRTPMLTRAEGGPITAYFRTRFTSYLAGNQTQLFLRQLVDDGAVFFLNGRELHRSRIPSVHDYFTPPDLAVGDAVYEGPFSLSAADLIAGENVIAVELHQAGSASTDIVFGAELMSDSVTSEILPALTMRRLTPHALEISWEDQRSRLQEASTPLGPWEDRPDATSPQVIIIPSGPAMPMFFRTIKP